ncbi:MAG: hypothetical protein JNN26_16245 [Candidatus Obscuribacter sp.]|nr:hypothetical protein [Candidatus Obscuribacter sp.]
MLFSIGVLIEVLSLARQRRNTAAREKEKLGNAAWQQIFTQNPYLTYGKNIVAAHSCLCILLFGAITCCYLKEELSFAAAGLASRSGHFELAERFYAGCKEMYRASSFAHYRGFRPTTATIDSHPTAQVLVKVYGRMSKPVADWQHHFGLNPEASLSDRVGALGEAANTYLELGLINDALAALASQATICLKDDEVMAARLVREAAALFPQSSYPMNSLTYFSLQYCARQLGDEEALKVFTTAELQFSQRVTTKRKSRGYVDATTIAMLLPLFPFIAFGLGTATVKELILWLQSRNLEKRYNKLSQTLSEKGKAAVGLTAAADTVSYDSRQQHRWQLIATLNSQIDLALYKGNTWLAEQKSLHLLQVAAEGTTSGMDGVHWIGEPESEARMRWRLGTLSKIVAAESGCLLLLTLFVMICAF